MKHQVPSKPSQTTNRLHFSDLDPQRFEDFCLNLIYPLRDWQDIRHYGRTGDDGGVDIFATEKGAENTGVTWYVQCRRYAKATKSTLIQAVDDALANTASPPDVLLVIVGCDVRRDSHEAFTEYGLSKSVKQSLLWTQSILEAKLYSERPDLLFVYFGIGKPSRGRSDEEELLHKLDLKEKMRRDFFKRDLPSEILRHPPWARLQITEAIIRAIDDELYPKRDPSRLGPSNWFKVELYNFYHNGLEVITSVESGILDEVGHWAIIEQGQEVDTTVYALVHVICVGRIPFRNIVNYDLRGDEYYNIPQIYCYYSPRLGPYEGFIHVASQDRQHWPLDEDLRLDHSE